MHEQLILNRQYGLPDTFRVPTEQDVISAVEEVLSEICPSAPVSPFESVVTITKTGKSRKPRSGKETPNLYQAEFKRIHSYYNMPSVVEDIFMGAVRQTVNNSHHNQYVVFNLMKNLKVISTESVYFAINSRRPKAEHVSVGYAQELAAVCRNVINAFGHHEEVENINGYIVEDTVYDDFDIESDAEGYQNHVQPVQTSEQKRLLLAKAGLTPAQVGAYMTGDKVMWGFSISTKAGSSVQVGSEHQEKYNELYSKESLKWVPSLCCYVDASTGEVVSWSE